MNGGGLLTTMRLIRGSARYERRGHFNSSELGGGQDKSSTPADTIAVRFVTR